VSTSLLVSTGAVSCYPASIVNLIWFANKKNVYRVSTKQHGDMKSGVSRSKNATILQAWCTSALSCSNIWKFSYLHRHVNVNVIALCIFCGCNCKTSKNLSSANQIFHLCQFCRLQIYVISYLSRSDCEQALVQVKMTSKRQSQDTVTPYFRGTGGNYCPYPWTKKFELSEKWWKNFLSENFRLKMWIICCWKNHLRETCLA